MSLFRTGLITYKMSPFGLIYQKEQKLVSFWTFHFHMSSWLWSMSMLKLMETFPCVYQRQLLSTRLRSVSCREGERSRSSWHKLFRNAGCVLCVEMLFPALITCMERWSELSAPSRQQMNTEQQLLAQNSSDTSRSSTRSLVYQCVRLTG